MGPNREGCRGCGKHFPAIRAGCPLVSILAARVLAPALNAPKITHNHQHCPISCVLVPLRMGTHTQHHALDIVRMRSEC